MSNDTLNGNMFINRKVIHFPDGSIRISCGDNLFWTLDLGVLTISGTGEMFSWNYEEAPWYSERDHIQTVIIENGVTNIGRNAFNSCTEMTNISIPVSVTDIAMEAFYDCSSLTDIFYSGTRDELALVEIGIHNQSFKSAIIHCVFIPDLILPSFLTSIESEAFVDLPRVKAIRIPATVTSISEDAFDPYVVIIAPTGSYAIDWAQQHGMNYQAE